MSTAKAKSFEHDFGNTSSDHSEPDELPSMESDASASELSNVLSDIGHLHADSISATRVIDEASSQFLVKRELRSRNVLPRHPRSGQLGADVIEKLQSFAVCTVGGDPGAGLSFCLRTKPDGTTGLT